MAAQAQTGTGNVILWSSTTGTTATFNKPANVADGDLLVAIICARNNTTDYATLPVGWTSVAPSGTELASIGTPRFYYKPIPSASAESATSYTWSGGTSSSRSVGVLTRVTGASLTSPLDVAGTEGAAATDGAGGTTITMGAATPTGTGDLLLTLALAHVATGGTRGFYAGPAGSTLVDGAGTTTTTAESDLSLHQQQLSASGNTGTRIYTRTGAVASGGGYHIAIKPLTSVTGVVTPASADTGVLRTLTLTMNNGNGNAVTWGPVDWGDGQTVDAAVTTSAGVTTKAFTRTPTVAGTGKTWSASWSQA